MSAERPFQTNAFMIIGNCKPGRAKEVRAMAAERTATVSVEALRELLKPLTIHYARWALINNDTQLIYVAFFDTSWDKYAEDAHQAFITSGVGNFFEAMEGYPDDWKTNYPAFYKFFNDRENESVFEFSDYDNPKVTVAEINGALAVRKSFSQMLDQMQ